MPPRQSIQSDNDPFGSALRPPPNETPEEREERERVQSLAREVSRQIDEGLLEDKKLHDKKKQAIKLLLLGQAESGKSTTLKNFQLEFCPAQFHKEFAAWKTVIQLNIIRSIKTLLDVITNELDLSSPSTSPPLAPGRSNTRASSSPTTGLSDRHRALRVRLSPLLAIEETLSQKLSTAFPKGSSTPTWDFTVRAGSGWQRVLSSATGGRSSATVAGRDDPTGVLTACCSDIVALWSDTVLRSVLKEKGIRIENSSGFFLDDIERIATWDYVPTDDDVLRTRIRTLGVEEHHFRLESASVDLKKDWYIYDVGGSRTSRDKWVPYFDDVDAIIFLAPLVFDQHLEEEPRINRLKDTLEIWKHVCSNKLLQKATLVLFLNKMDVLARTLADGVQVRDFIPVYDGPNEFNAVVEYFRNVFIQMHKKYTQHLPARTREVRVHQTSVINQANTREILNAVRLGILTANLERIALM